MHANMRNISYVRNSIIDVRTGTATKIGGMVLVKLDGCRFSISASTYGCLIPYVHGTIYWCKSPLISNICASRNMYYLYTHFGKSIQNHTRRNIYKHTTY